MSESHWKKGVLKKTLEFIFGIEAYLSAKWVSASHRRLFISQWHIQPSPEWMDHSIDLYYQWPNGRSPQMAERGCYNVLALKGGNILELCCGDGFFTKFFYSNHSQKIIACDFDPTAIVMAKKKNYLPNIDYILADIRTSMPAGVFPNIIWDAAIEHFTEEEIGKIMLDIKDRLTEDGILSGYTIVEKEDGVKQLHQHEYEFRSKEDLKRFLTPHFKNVCVFETIYKERHNLFFWASDAIIPFSKEYDKMTIN